MFDLDSPWFDLAKALEDARMMDKKHPEDKDLKALYESQKPARAAEREDEDND